MENENNFKRLIKRFKFYVRANKKRILIQLSITFVILTIVTGQSAQALEMLSTGETISWNPFMLFYCAWVKMFLISFALWSIINIAITYIIVNMDDKYFDKERNFQISSKGTLGTGGFMTQDDKEKALIMDKVDNIDGMIIGKDIETDFICSPKSSLFLNGHKVVCGGSGARKTTTQVLNDLLQIIKREESFIVTDPKAEIYELLSVLCEAFGYRTRVMNLVNLRNSDGVDFVKCLRDRNGNRDIEVENAQTLSQVIMSNTTENVTGGFWDDNQKGLLTAAVLYVMYDETGRTEPTLAGAYDLLLKNDKTELDRLFSNLDIDHPSRAQYLIYAKTEAKVRDSVVNGLMMRLQIFQANSTKRIVSEDEIDLTLPSKQKCAYFLVMSDQKRTYDFISSLFFSMFFIKEVEYVDSLPKNVRESSILPVNLVMDEFPSIGTIPDFSRKLATLRSRKILITIIFQNYGQIIDKYENNDWQTIVANCDVNIYLGGNDSEETAKYYSNRLGEMTVISKGKRTTERIASATDNRFHPSYMTTESESSRAVMTTDEILRLEPDYAIVMLKSCRPLKVKKYVYTEHPYAQMIVERNATTHIPSWRREAEGIPELSDEILAPLICEMESDGSIKQYMELHSKNRKYNLMQYLKEHKEVYYDRYSYIYAKQQENEGDVLPPLGVQSVDNMKPGNEKDKRSDEKEQKKSDSMMSELMFNPLGSVGENHKVKKGYSSSSDNAQSDSYNSNLYFQWTSDKMVGSSGKKRYKEVQMPWKEEGKQNVVLRGLHEERADSTDVDAISKHPDDSMSNTYNNTSKDEVIQSNNKLNFTGASSGTVSEADIVEYIEPTISSVRSDNTSIAMDKPAAKASDKNDLEAFKETDCSNCSNIYGSGEVHNEHDNEQQSIDPNMKKTIGKDDFQVFGDDGVLNYDFGIKKGFVGKKTSRKGISRTDISKF